MPTAGQTGVLCSAFRPDGTALALGYRTGAVVVTSLDDGRELGRATHAAWPNDIAFDATGAFLASAGFDQRVHVWRLDDFSEVWQRTTPDMAGDVDVAGDRLVATGFDDRVVVLGLADGAERASLPHGGRVLAARFAPDHGAVLTETGDGVLTLWDADSAEKLHEVRVDRYAAHPHLLPSGDVVAGVGDEVQVLNLSREEST